MAATCSNNERRGVIAEACSVKRAAYPSNAGKPKIRAIRHIFLFLLFILMHRNPNSVAAERLVLYSVRDSEQPFLAQAYAFVS